MSFPNDCGVYAILYADDILLISPTVCMLQNMLTTCELELQALDLDVDVDVVDLRAQADASMPASNNNVKLYNISNF